MNGPDDLDACPVGAPETSPALLPWVVLFASVLDDGRVAIVARARSGGRCSRTGRFVARALWLADVLRAAGLAVVEVDGWQDRDASPDGTDTLAAGGVVGHHTAGPYGGGDMPSLAVLCNGRPDLAGPLANLGLGRSGTYYTVASGKANHAGNGGWAGLSGNSSVIGIEAENDGYQPWPDAQLDAYWRGSAAVLAHLGAGAGMWCRHHEWRAEKPDPHDLSGDYCRGQITAWLETGPASDEIGGGDVAGFVIEPGDSLAVPVGPGQVLACCTDPYGSEDPDAEGGGAAARICIAPGWNGPPGAAAEEGLGPVVWIPPGTRYVIPTTAANPMVVITHLGRAPQPITVTVS